MQPALLACEQKRGYVIHLIIWGGGGRHLADLTSSGTKSNNAEWSDHKLLMGRSWLVVIPQAYSFLSKGQSLPSMSPVHCSYASKIKYL